MLLLFNKEFLVLTWSDVAKRATILKMDGDIETKIGLLHSQAIFTTFSFKQFSSFCVFEPETDRKPTETTYFL